MSSIPPIPPSYGASSSGQGPTDPGANELLQLLRSMEGNSDPAQSHFATLAYNWIEQQPNVGTADGSQIIQWIQECQTNIYSLVYPSAPNNPNADLYMVFAAQGWWTSSSDDFSTQIATEVNTIAQQYNIKTTLTPETPTSSDLCYLNLLGWKNGQASPSMAQFLGAILHDMVTDPNAGSNDGGAGAVWSYVSSLLSDSNFFTTYANPPVTVADITTLANTLLPVNSEKYTVPEYFSEYLTLGYSLSGLAAGPLKDLTADLLKQMALGIGHWTGQSQWTLGTTAQLQSWMTNMLSSTEVLETYPGIRSADITAVAQDIGVALPPALGQYFDAIAALMPKDPTSPDYAVVANFQHQWMQALFANPSTWNGQTWFSQAYGTPGQALPAGMNDLFMLYPLADTATLTSLAQAFFSGASYTPTSWDTAYRTLYAAHGGESSGIYPLFFAECQSVGSSDANQAIEQWINQFAMQGFVQYPTIQPSDTINFLNNFPFTSIIGGKPTSYIADYIESYIQEVWIKAPGRTEDETRFGRQVVAEVAAQIRGGVSSFADLKTYIDGRIPAYEAAWPDVPPSTITDLFATFNLYP
jgi:hypothetical protein